MKNTKVIYSLLVVLLLVITKAETALGQNEKSDALTAIKNLIESDKFTFKAEFVLPSEGSSWPLTYDCGIVITRDTVKYFLPFLGRASNALWNPSHGSFQYTWTDFNYTIKERKKGGWNIMIKPNGINEVTQLLFTVSKLGSSSLQVLSNHREPAFFNGSIRNNKSGYVAPLK